MVRRLYMDNAATSFPKPPAVYEAMGRYAVELGASPGRGAYRESTQSAELLNQCRGRINTLIGGADPNHVIFTLNCTDALNQAIKGVMLAGERRGHVITTALEHNSILRPLNQLQADGIITQTQVPCDPITGLVDPNDIAKAIRPETRLIAMLHGSNVTGTLQDIETVGRIAAEHQNVFFLVDAAQSLGHVPINVQQLGIDLLAAPGHKGLLGPLGTGILYIRPGVQQHMVTTREGGTGSVSENDAQPDFMPDRFEAGSHNTHGIVGLSEGVAYILQRTVEDLHRHQTQLIAAFIEALNKLDTPGLHMFGPPTGESRCGVFSIRIDGFDNPLDLSNTLEQQFGILTRPGLHCAPGAHRTIGTLGLGGTTRLSFGSFLSVDDVRYAAEAISSVCIKRSSSLQTS